MGTATGGVVVDAGPSANPSRRRRATINDVAERAGVSKGLVSFVLNDRAGVAPATRDRILDVVRELDWRPNQRARSLTTARAYALGLVLARPAQLLADDPFFPAFISGIESELSARTSSLVLQVVPDVDAELGAYRRMFADHRVDGVVVADLRHHDPRPAALAALGLPAVTLGRPDCPRVIPAVVLDDTPGITAAVEHLVLQGHERIAFVGGPHEFLHAHHRAMAWRTALTDLGVGPGRHVDGDFSGASGAAAMSRLLALPAPERPTAVMFANDLMALAGIAHASRNGLRVPGDISVVGFDDITAAAHVHPALTTVAQDAQEWGRAAGRAVFDLVERGIDRDIDLPPARLILRESTAAPARTAPRSASPVHHRKRPAGQFGEQS